MSNPNSAPLLATLSITSVAGAVTVLGSQIVECLDAFGQLKLVVVCTGSAGGTTDVYLQSRHGLATWVDLAHFPQLPGAGAVTYQATLNRCSNTQVPVVTGQGATPALAANVVVPGDFGDALRMVVVGGGGSAGLQTSTCAVYGCAAPGGRA
jgi:hypothetical protein